MRAILFLSLFLIVDPIVAQLNDGRNAFTRADSLRGSIGPERAWWDVRHYAVFVTPDLDQRTIKGRTYITFTATKPGRRMQIDLQQPLEVDSIHLWLSGADLMPDGQHVGEIAIRTPVPFQREGDVMWVDLPRAFEPGEGSVLCIDYHGKPKAAKNPPWDGGWIWKKDAQGNPWVSVACQGLGASVWYPCKDHQGDEPQEGATLRITVADSLQAIGNGRLRGTSSNSDGTTTWEWQVSDPINTYNLVPYIGKYAHWNEVYAGVDGPLPCDYWVLAANEAKARAHFKQVPEMLRCFEEWLGPYPFYRDGFKLVEAPHLGMEHQSAIAYGNNYVNGYRGSDLSGTGHGLEWDYIIVHESGHEWFGNSITTADIADMWVHEGFTDYTETIFTECQQGPAAAQEYVIGLRKNIQNDRPIIGPYGVNEEGSGDMYYKGANLIHMIRHIVGDSIFQGMLRDMNATFKHSVVTSAQVEAFMIGYNATTRSLLHPSLFDQYLRSTKIPVLEYTFVKRRLWMRWSNAVPGLQLPVMVEVGGDTLFTPLGTQWPLYSMSRKYRKSIRLKVDPAWYVGVRKLSRRESKALKGIDPPPGLK
jgi:aminopeptidase N